MPKQGPFGDAVLDFLFSTGRTLRHRRATTTTIKAGPKLVDSTSVPSQKDISKASLVESGVAASPIPPTATAPTELQPNESSEPKAEGVSQPSPAEVASGAVVENTTTKISTHTDSEWTADQDATILRMKDEENVGFAKIGVAIGKSKKQISARYHELKKTEKKDEGANATKEKSAEHGKKGGRKGKWAADTSKAAKEKDTDATATKNVEKTTQEKSKRAENDDRPSSPSVIADDGIAGRRLSLVVQEDINFSIEELAIISQIIHDFQSNIWLTLCSRFWDIRGWRPHPAQLKLQWSGEASSDVASSGCDDDERELSDSEMKLIRTLMDAHLGSMWVHIAAHFNIETGRCVHPKVIRAKFTGEEDDMASELQSVTAA